MRITDRKRMDWVEGYWNNGHPWAMIHTHPANGYGFATDSIAMHRANNRKYFKTLREAIDAAIKKSGSKEPKS